MDVSIIGGGLSGIFAAKTLRGYGHNSVIIEKSRSVGGRMATRRIGSGHADHGAQFFTVRSKELQTLANEWLEKGWIQRWFGNDYPRYAGTNGMNPFVKNLASDLSIKLNEQVVKIESTSSSVTLETAQGHSFKSDATIITAPVPQTLSLLQQSPLLLKEEIERNLATSHFNPAFVGLISLKSPINIGEKGIISNNLPSGVDKIVANDEKGISLSPILSVYMTGEWSAERFMDQDESIINQLVDIITPNTVRSEMINDVQLKRWRYAEASHVYDEPFLKLDNYPIYIAGDSFLMTDDTSGRTRVESAILSGIRAGEAIHKRLLSI
ncbi:NAD(P)/FAD-dependent oxidoreductase [Salipaludibacillus sp. HK11]|uniref:NAD(P)/FAD-dependent oxidoreductase n=1 Tax=Salipaludibacillus sp. HK11 TaxID=3394320 RepID=UPI0039FD5F77